MELIDRLDPDKWMAAGNKLLDYCYPPDTDEERQAMHRAFDKHPDLKVHVGRWMDRVKSLGAPGEKIGNVLTEEHLRELWEETRRAALS